jgi:hypothetical protein
MTRRVQSGQRRKKQSKLNRTGNIATSTIRKHITLSKAEVRAIWVSLLCILGQRKKRPTKRGSTKEEEEEEEEEEATNRNQAKQNVALVSVPMP